ncbi:hypothetical protein CQ13_34900 [Bradyrhizobium retamae]|uniref:Uncharacterized protein n=1 Tax=Bradyrhizobium retamae TaxID=1300035 RepID=A0A0R3MFZ3_9BRAD|nr:hypothetical protein CQ13_34900 [Bradyrhizobium retamae]
MTLISELKLVSGPVAPLYSGGAEPLSPILEGKIDLFIDLSIRHKPDNQGSLDAGAFDLFGEQIEQHAG